MNSTRHFWLRDKDKRTVGCVATKRTADDMIIWAVAAVNPKDNKNFNRDLGKRIAYGRLEKNRNAMTGGVFALAPNTNVKLWLMSQLAFYGPPVTQPAAQWWLQEHQNNAVA